MNLATLVYVSSEQVSTTIHDTRRTALEYVASDHDLTIPEGLDDDALEAWLDDNASSSFYVEEHTHSVPGIVVTVEAGCVNQVAAKFPLDVLIVDKDTESAEEDAIVTLPDNSTATTEWDSAEVDAEYVDAVIALADA